MISVTCAKGISANAIFLTGKPSTVAGITVTIHTKKQPVFTRLGFCFISEIMVKHAVQSIKQTLLFKICIILSLEHLNHNGELISLTTYLRLIYVQLCGLTQRRQ